MISRLSPLPQVRSKNMSQRVVDDISTKIKDGVLNAGDRVPPEPELMKVFGISRTVVRESMQRLQAAGLVETRHGIGTFVLALQQGRPLLADTSADITSQDVMAMLELRISVETEAAGLAASRRSESHLAGMRAALEAFAASQRNGTSTVEADFQFHLQIARATNNRYFEEVLRSLGEFTIEQSRRLDGQTTAANTEPAKILRFGEAHPLLEQSKLLTLREHEDIYECVSRADPAAARAAMFMHLSNSRERKRRAIQLANESAL